MTTRKLHDQAREHGLPDSKQNNNTALGDHYRERHNEKEQSTKKPSKKLKKSSRNESNKKKFKGSPKINFKTIKHQPGHLRLHIEETIAIKQLKPTLKRRQETLGTGFLPYFFPLFARFLSIHLYICIILTFICTLHTSLLLTCTSSLS